MAGFDFRRRLRDGIAIPAHPLALDRRRRLDERRQRALTRYYLAAGAGGLAVGVHTTEFRIRDPAIGLFEPVLALAAEEMDRAQNPVVRIGGICGKTSQAIREAETLRTLGYHAGLLSLAAWEGRPEGDLIAHCRAVAAAIPLVGFYLQPAAGGPILPLSFWRRFARIENVAAIKVAPFNRYRTIEVVRAVCESGRDDIALYTGNDDHIVLDLLTPYRFGGRDRRIVGGLLGHWSVWTHRAVKILNRCRRGRLSPALLRLAVEVTDANAAFFDAANGFRGCLPGLLEILRRQGLLEGTFCLDPGAGLSPGQEAEIDRVCRAYSHLSDDGFVAAHRDEWLAR